jgi:hypothetical protein
MGNLLECSASPPGEQNAPQVGCGKWGEGALFQFTSFWKVFEGLCVNGTDWECGKWVLVLQSCFPICLCVRGTSPRTTYITNFAILTFFAFFFFFLPYWGLN